MIGRTLSHYTIVEELGRGGMGVVYRADDERLGRAVALKLLPSMVAGDPEAKERFIQEARAASGFEHPNICSIHDIGETPEGELFLVMPAYEGETLRDRMARTPLDTEAAADMARQVAAGLSQAHGRGIVHRDIKPDNLMVLEDGRVVILDFGVAKLAEGLDLTSVGSTVGTAAYMSPEQTRGDEVDGRSDLFALGAILYEALAGARPFAGSYDQAVIYSILNAEPDPLPESVPAELASIVGRLLEKEADKRFATASDLVDALTAFLGGAATGFVQVAKPDASASRRWMVYGVAGAVAILAVVALIIALASGEAGPESDPDPAIAVLPFDVQGPPDIAYLGRGVSTLLASAIDGAGGLRAVDPISVASALGQESAGVESARRIIGAFGARGAILGSVIQIGGRITLQAAFYDVDGRPGETREGVAESQEELPAAVDALARALIAQQFSGSGQGMETLSAITSHNFDALKHYLEGERLVGEGEFSDSYDALTRAVEADSTFAMAWYRRSSISGWGGASRGTSRADILAAFRLARGLPERARLLISAQMAHAHDSIWTARGRWREIVRRYPDDAHATFRLGDNLLHYNKFIGRSDLEAIPVLRRATQLDLTNQEAGGHLMEYAIRDTAWTAVDSLAADPESLTIARARQSARGDLDTLFDELSRADVDWTNVVHHAVVARLPELVIRAVDSLSVGNPSVALLAYPYEVLLGRPSRAEVQLANTSRVDPVEWILGAHPLTYHPDLRRFARTAPPFGATSAVGGWHAYLHAVRAVTLGEEAVIPAFLDTIRSVGTPGSNYYLESVRALRYWTEGDHAGALAILERERGAELQEAPGDGIDADIGITNPRTWPQWLRAELLFEAGRLEEAAKWYRTFHQLDTGVAADVLYAAPAHRRLAEIAEALGDENEAIRQYERFLRYWYDVDPELQPAVDEAKARLDALLARRSGEA